MRPRIVLGSTAAALALVPVPFALLGGQRAAVAALTVAGAFATVAGLLWGVRGLRREYRHLKPKYDAVKAAVVAGEHEQERLDAILEGTSDFGDVAYLRELIRINVLQQAYDNLGEPLGMALLGLVASTGASIWSLWV
ncbi:hypothetical protein [Streptomyces sp. NPDC093589]|uniref:hypothetical protein n=1 Tax=Streptomyces sp. NPDC093589 TaxID=3366043 RepID=UPI003825E223